MYIFCQIRSAYNLLYILLGIFEFQEYFNYVQRCNFLGESGKQWNILQLEWDRVKSFCVKIKGGEAQAGRVFWYVYMNVQCVRICVCVCV